MKKGARTPTPVKGRRPGATPPRERAPGWQALIGAMTDVVIVLDAEGRYRWIAPTGANLLYRPPDEMLGRTLHEVLPQDTADCFLHAVREALEQRRPVPVEYNLTIGGAEIWFEGAVSPMGKDRALWVVRDVTERRRAAAEHAASVNRLRAIVGAEPECVKVVSRLGRLLEMNPSGLAMLEAESVEQLQARDLMSVIAPEHRAAYAAMTERVLAGGSGTVEFEVIGLRGTRRWLDAHMVPLRDAQGTVTATLAVSRDVTARRRAERINAATLRIATAALTARDLPDLLRTLHGVVAELMPARNLFVALEDPATGIVSFPYFADEQDPTPPVPHVPGRSLTAYVMRTGAPLLASAEVFREMVARGEVDEIGAPSIDWIGVPLRVAERVIGVLAVQSYTEGVRYGQAELDLLRFVSTQVALAIERTRAREDMRREKDFSESIIAALPGIFYLLDDAGRLRRWSVALEQVTGWSGPEIAQMGAVDFIAESDQALVNRRIQEVFATGASSVEADVVTADGTRIPYFLTGRRLDIGGRPVLVGVGIDISERRRLEQQFHQAQKMEAVGRLAGGVAHDFNNLLTAILAQADFLLADRADGEPGREEVEEIRAAALRAAQLTQQLLAFSRRQVLQMQVVDLNAVVTEAETMLRRLIGEHIRLVTDLEPAVWPVRADAGQVQQVIVNLAVNARDAMPRGGTLTITTHNIAVTADVAEEHHWVTGEQAVAPLGDHVMLEVHDTGEGMDPETRRRIFEPFFTTKERGRGTGLGLSMAYGVIKQSGGWIWADSQPGRGTTFTIHLPRAEGVVAEPRPSEPAGVADTTGSGTILLVEDEASVRAVVRSMLQRRGFAVLEAEGPEAALALADGHAGHLDLLLTDVVMPGMSGRDLADQLTARRPGLRVLYMSGHTDDDIVTHGVLEPGIAFIQKPFTTIQLDQRLREVMARGR